MVCRYQPYPVYMDSGLEWLGALPEHWKVKRLGHFFEERREKVSDKYYSALSVTKQGIVPQLDNAAKTDAGDNRKLVLKNDFVINSRSDRKGSSGVSCLDGSVSLISIVMTPRKINPRFAHHLLRSYPFQEEFYRYGKGIVADLWSTNSSEMKNILMPDIPEKEEESIANFLDHETAKIDTLIEKQQQLIKLLKEKRQAVISHAVTKGLNPNAPMRDSGVEWLGTVPQHWAVKRLKHISPKVGVGLVINPSTYTQDKGVYFIFGGDVKEYYFDLSKTRRISPENSDNLLPSRLNHRDLLSVRVGYPGITAVVTEELEGANCASVIVIRRGEYNSDWLCAAMNVWVGRQQVDLVSYGAAQKQFNVADAIEFVFPVPPHNEQDSIANFIQDSLNRFNTLTHKAETQIKLLQERRTALISAAVTGKIDVRNWQAPQPSNKSNNNYKEVAA